MYNFKDIFGFDQHKAATSPHQPDDEGPGKQFNTERFMARLSKTKIGERPQISPGEVRWGNRNGSVGIQFGTKLNLFLQRQGLDLQGQARWATKKLHQIERQNFQGFEEDVADKIERELQQIAKGPLDSPKKEFKDFEYLAQKMSERINAVSKPYFKQNGIWKENPHLYIIRLVVSGQGVGLHNGNKANEFQVMLNFRPEEGVLSVRAYSIESKTGRDQEWKLKPSELDLVFFPTQPWNEIIDPVANTLHWY